jgi:hypothetical protein
MPTNYITLPRSKLYELVWSKPVTELAKEFGISDVALAKRCRAINILLPEVGERGVFTTRPNVSSSARTPAH